MAFFIPFVVFNGAYGLNRSMKFNESSAFFSFKQTVFVKICNSGRGFCGLAVFQHRGHFPVGGIHNFGVAQNAVQTPLRIKKIPGDGCVGFEAGTRPDGEGSVQTFGKSGWRAGVCRLLNRRLRGLAGDP